jgi:hypothetical protein
LRFRLHAGKGRTWQLDPALKEHEVDKGDDIRELAARAKKLEDQFDWWEIYEPDEGMRMIQGWSTGRTTPHLLEALHAYVVPRARAQA